MFYKRNNTFKINLVDKDLEFSEYKKTIVENDVWIGYGAIVLDGIKISNGAIIGAGSIVTKDIPPYAIAVGIPAKIIKYRFDNNKIDKLIKSSWWDNDPYEIKKTIKHLNNL